MRSMISEQDTQTLLGLRGEYLPYQDSSQLLPSILDLGTWPTNADGTPMEGFYVDLAKEACIYYNIHSQLNVVLGIIRAESTDNPNALGPPTKYGQAKGLMQLLPDAMNEMGVTDPFNPRQNIFGGVGYFARQLKRFGNVQTALAAYNWGPNRKTITNGQTWPNDTKEYIRKVLQYANQYTNSAQQTFAVNTKVPFNKKGLHPGPAQYGDILLSKYPGITSILGVGTRPNESFHPSGRAIDVMTTGAYGNAIANRAAQDLIRGKGTQGYPTEVIWNGRIITLRRISEGWRPYNGASPHTDHVHLGFENG